MFDIHGVFLYINHMAKFKNKKLKKLYLKGFKAARSKRPTQDEYDLMMAKKIKEYSRDNKINVVVTSEFFYDSFDYNVEGYDEQEFYTIPAHYTAYRHFYNDIMSGADCPTHIKIIKSEPCKHE